MKKAGRESPTSRLQSYAQIRQLGNVAALA
jgi:hypothetical protein